MSQFSSPKKKSLTEPLYFDEVINYRDNWTKPQSEEVCMRFVPRDHEISAVYHTPLTDLLSRTDLPLLIRLRHDLDLAWDRTAGKLRIKRGQVLMLHFIIRPRRVFATDRRGKDVVLPFLAKQLYDILPIEPGHDDKIFKSTSEVIKCKPLPKHLRVLIAFLSEKPQESQEVDDVIDISHVERHGNSKVLVGRDRITKTAIAYSEQMTSRYTTMLYETPLSLSEILSSHSLPMRIRKTEQRSETFVLQECKDEAQVICTVPGWRQVFALALTSTVHVEEVLDGVSMPPLTDIVPQLYPLMNWTWGVKEVGREPLPDRLAEIPHPKLGVLCEWINSKEGLALVERIAEGEDKSKRETMAEQHEKIKFLERQIGAANALPPPLPRRSTPAPPVKTRSRSVVARYNTDNTYNVIQFPPVAAPRKIDPKQIEIDGLKGKIETLQREKKEHLAKIAELQARVGNPLQTEYQSIHERQAYATCGPSYKLPDTAGTHDDMESATVNDVVNFVSSIGLTHYAEVFKTEDINGALLLELDEDIFHTELGLSKLNAKRLKMEIQKKKN